MIEEHMSQTSASANALRKVFQEEDVHGANLLSHQDLESHRKNSEVTAYLKFLELDVFGARSLFQLLDSS